jgi:MFS family permease
MAGILRLEGVPVLLAVYFLVMLGFNLYYVAFPVHAAESLHWSARQVGAYFSILSLSMVVVQGPILSRASKRVSDAALSVLGSLILATSFVFFLSKQGSVLYMGAMVLALGNGLMWPSVVSMLSKAAGERHQGAVQGFASGLGAAASILGLLTGGILFARLEARIFLVSAATILCVFVLALALWSRSPENRRSVGSPGR